MSQNFNKLLGSSIIKNDRETINENFDAIRSAHSGTSFPSKELVAGMEFFNTSTKKLYRLQPDLSTWTLELDLSSGIAVVAKASNADTAATASKDANGKDISTYIAKLESDVNNAFVINFYDGQNNKLGSVTIPETEVMTGASSSSAGKAGLVPAPSAGDNDKFLCGDGSFKEAGKVKSVNGKIGDVVVDLPVGHMYWSVEKTVPAGRLPAQGVLYNRPLYQDLYTWADERGLVISEAEWQSIASANGGNCAYYSSGDGSTTFRVPSIKCWVKGANSVDEVGIYLEAGLPAIGGSIQPKVRGITVSNSGSNTFYCPPDSSVGTLTPLPLENTATIYGNSNTVQPPSIVGQWLIVAFGVAHNIGEADVANVMQAVEQVQTQVGAIEQGVGTAIDYVVESWRNGAEWYEVYKSGKVRQGGWQGRYSYIQTVTLHLPMADTKYFSNACTDDVNARSIITYNQTTTSFKKASYNDTPSPADCEMIWFVEGMGAGK